MKLMLVMVGAVMLLALVIALPSCTVGLPYQGPGLPEKGAPDMVVVAVTHAYLHTDRRDAFDDYTFRVADMMKEEAIEGMVGFSIRKELVGDEAWTYSVWTDFDALDRFAEHPLHQEAIATAGHAIKRLEVRRFEVPATELPLTWDRALAALADEEPRVGLRTESHAAP